MSSVTTMSTSLLDVPLVEFMCLTFTCTPGECYPRQLIFAVVFVCQVRVTLGNSSLLLCLCAR